MARILIIDDDSDFLQTLSEMMKEQGYKVHVAANGLEGVHSVECNTYDLVIVDILMPGKDGLEVIRDLRRDNAQIKILALSGGGTGDSRDYLNWAKKMGANQTLSKPFKWDEFMYQVKKAISFPKAA